MGNDKASPKTTPFLPSFLCSGSLLHFRLLSSCPCYHCRYTQSLQWGNKWHKGSVYGQYMVIFLCCSFPHTSFFCFNVGSPWTSTSFWNIQLVWCVLFPPQSAVWTSAPGLEHLFLLWPCCLHCCFPFSFFIPLPVQCFFPHLRLYYH